MGKNNNTKMQQQDIKLADLAACPLPKLKAIAKSRKIAPNGDKRRRDVWVKALENSLLEEMKLGELKAEVASRDGLGFVDGDKRLRATWMEALRQALHPEDLLGEQEPNVQNAVDEDEEPARVEPASMSLTALKAIARQHGVVPQGDKRRREVWCQAVAGIYARERSTASAA